MDESSCCLVLRVFIIQGILVRVFTSESLWFSSLSCCLIFFLLPILCSSENIYCGLNPDTAKCCCVFDGS